MFDCAFQPRNGTRSIPWKAHIRMMAAAQPFISGAISKTVNMPKESTPDDVADAYMEGWRLGLKALAIYRDGSKEVQPLSTKTKADKAAEKLVAAPRRERLPDTRQSITHKFSISGHEGYITVGLYPDGRPGELFITMAKEGSTIGGLMDCFGTAVSMSLQYGVPLEVYVNKFSHTRFEPMGFTKNPDIRIAKSIVDYIFRWLGITFLPGYREANKALPPSPADPRRRRNRETRRQSCGPPPRRPAGRPRRTDRRRPRPPRPTVRRRRPANGRRRVEAGRQAERPPVDARAASQRRPPDDRRPASAAFPQRAVRLVPDRRPDLRQLRRDHRPQRQLLPLLQLRQQHGMLVERRGTSASSVEPEGGAADDAFVWSTGR